MANLGKIRFAVISAAVVVSSFIVTDRILNWQSITVGEISIRADQLTHGVGVQIGTNPEFGNRVLQHSNRRPPSAYVAEFEFDSPISGTYFLEVEYATDVSRPRQIQLNGTILTKEGLVAVTGGLDENSQRWIPELPVNLVKGRNVVRFEGGSLPHIRALRFMPK